MTKKPDPIPAPKHGTRRLRCVCPGCGKMVPACWMAQMCVECATENCDHAEAQERRKKKGARK